MGWTKRKAERYQHLCRAMEGLGFTTGEVDALLKIERTLGNWAIAECNGEIQRDEETGKPYRHWETVRHTFPDGKRVSTTVPRKTMIADRETPALARAKALIESKGLRFYNQGDPRGCSVYIVRPEDVPEGKDIGAYYSRGIAVCID